MGHPERGTSRHARFMVQSSPQFQRVGARCPGPTHYRQEWGRIRVHLGLLGNESILALPVVTHVHVREVVLGHH